MAVAGAGTLFVLGLALVAVNEIQARWLYPGLAGVWEGTCFNERIAVKIIRTNGLYQASFDYIDSGIDLPAVNLKPGRTAISFHVAGSTSRFAARIDPGMNQMTGIWHEGKGDYPVTLKRRDTPEISPPLTETDYAPRPGSDLQGLWRGAIKLGGRPYAMNLN